MAVPEQQVGTALFLLTKKIIMKQRIVYEIRGQIERNCFFRIGKSLVRVEFTGGSVNSAGISPAQYITDNPLYQHAIENSADFRNGIITRGFVQNIDGSDAEESNAIENDDSSENTYPHVTNTQQARAVLMGVPFKCPLSELQNKASVRAKAQVLNVLFPNWI